MPKYIVTAEMKISVHTVVEAKSVIEARSKALDHPMIGLCGECADGEPEEEWVTSGELDGSPRRLEVEEL